MLCVLPAETDCWRQKIAAVWQKIETGHCGRKISLEVVVASNEKMKRISRKEVWIWK